MQPQRMSSKIKGGGRVATQAHTVFELKHRVVLSLNKLADRDTYQIGAEELEKITEGLTPEGIAPFLSCIIDTDSEQKSAVRKECIKVLGTLARVHGNLMSVHVGKMVTSIVKRLKDSDSSVRDSCVETAGILAKTVGSSSGGGSGSGFVTLVKPLFEALGEQNRYVQSGSALCLTRVIDEAAQPLISLLAQMLTRVVKLLKNQHFMAKPAVIGLIRSIVQVGGASTENAQHLALTSITEALKCSDWTTRKAASLALAEIAVSCGSAFGYLKTSCICSLESCRFDKVKPVRDAVVHALQCWKALTGTDACDPSEVQSSTKDIKKGGCTGLTCNSDAIWRDISNKASPVSSLNGVSRSSIEKQTSLIIRKKYPDQMQYHHHKDPNDWHTEESVSKRHIASLADNYSKKQQLLTISKEYQTSEDAPDDNDCSNMSNFMNRCCESKHVIGDAEYIDDVSSANIISINSGPETEEVDSEGYKTLKRDSMDSTVSDIGSHRCCLSTSNELAFIREQLLDIKTRQSELLNLLEVFMGNTTANLSSLHLKVHNLEGAVDEIAQSFTQKGSNLNAASLKYLKKKLSASSFPRISTCTPRPLSDNSPRSTFSSNRTQLSAEKFLSRSGSSSPTSENSGLWRDPTIKLVRNPVEMDMKKTGSNQVKETENLFPVLTSNICSKQRSFKVETNSWKNISDHMHARDLDSAYEEALSYGDAVRLLELMNTTGPVLEKLSPDVADKILDILPRKFLNHRFISLMMPWVQQVVDLSQVQGPKKPFVSGKAQMEFLHALEEMAEVQYIDRDDRFSIVQFAAKLSKVMGEAASRKSTQSRVPSGSIKLANNAKV